jgi:SnoaL-like domain
MKGQPVHLADFALGDEVLLIGSDLDEIATGSQELASFFARIFARDTTFSSEWDRIDVSYTDNLGWFFADGRVVLSSEKEKRKSPYRITRVLQRQGERWLWRHYHGSEPVKCE